MACLTKHPSSDGTPCCHMKVLRSLAAPVLHHARARRVVDMAQHSHSTASTAPAPHSTAPAPHSTHSTQEIHLTVDQLLRSPDPASATTVRSSVLEVLNVVEAMWRLADQVDGTEEVEEAAENSQN
ncbi:hypothetical protein GWK47_004490 [Chionoecetes opilio]|uniref:Uncharacterized protein n=1 Tax=Chionoecetes opilio TaxID=41210 RepID=A0A8J5CYN2_CHIOP|nr:hypothetical protein GWK47_004490 [Chionoecetes opilio]